LRDVTEQKSLSRKLAKRENILSQITETIDDVFYLYNIPENKYEYISPNCNLVLGADSQFFYSGKSHTKSYVHHDYHDNLKKANQMVNEGTSYNIDYPIQIDGITKWINEKSFPIKNKKGEIIFNSGICRDITELKEAEETIFKQSLEIASSISYAQRLQEAVLPSNTAMGEIFKDSFVLYSPKDVVSGDFYVVDYIRTNNNMEIPSFIVGDCTGHGIPGAVLSLMCNVLVRESFTRNEINSPSEALDFVRNRLVRFFKAGNEKRIQDGMDISFCVLNKTKKQLYFAGANSSCIIIRNNELVRYKGDKQHIGYNDNPLPFKNHVIDVKKGDSIYLYTDGYMDQFGGENDKKYTRKRLHEQLLNKNHLSMQEIRTILNTNFLEWKQDTEQIDDVTILGLRIE